jgi:hypothetical protein
MLQVSDRARTRFFRLLDASKAEGCWPWAGHVGARGYGRIIDGDKTLRAHRIAYSLLVGPVNPGQVVCHHCDNPKCVNPAHLFVGTQLDNIRDRCEKGRTKVPLTTKDVCKRGHARTPDNLYGKDCKQCVVERVARHRASGYVAPSRLRRDAERAERRAARAGVC